MQKSTFSQLAFFGIGVRVESQDSQILEWLEFDFRLFVDRQPGSKADFSFAVVVGPPPGGSIPPLDEIMHTPAFVCFENASKRYVDYQGKALAIYDYENEAALIYAPDAALAYEKLYLAILSRVGERLDMQGFHRVHSLGITFNDRACLFLIPQGGGKTTLCLSLLAHKEVKLLSEDTPIVNRKAEVFAFPFRLGVIRGENTESIPPDFKREIEHKTGGHKILVDLSYCADKMAAGAHRNAHLFCGRWTTQAEPRIVPMSKLSALGYLMRDCVFGLGLPQVIEFFLQSGARQIVKKAGIALSRLSASVALVLSSRCYQLYLCRDKDKNAGFVKAFLESQAAPGNN